MPQQWNFKADWNYLWSLPFHRGEKSGEVFKRVYDVAKNHPHHPDHQWLWLVKEWLLIPYTLWRVPMDGMVAHMCNVIEAGQRFDPHLLLLLELLQTMPPKEEQEVIILCERCAEKGDYSMFISDDDKYEPEEKELFANAKCQHQWNLMSQAFNLDNYRDRYGILRRTPAQERNFRTRDWQKFRWENEEYRFQAIFDTFAVNWRLFGVEGNKMLLQKLTMSATNMGWITFWPAGRSPDGRRDIKWQPFVKAARARGVKRQGRKMSEGRLERQQQARRALAAALKAEKDGKRGDERIAHIIKEAKLSPALSKRAIQRLIAEGRTLEAEDAKPIESPKFDVATLKAAAHSMADGKPPTSNGKLKKVLTLIQELTPEEKKELVGTLMSA